MSDRGRQLTRKERAQATAEYLAQPHPPIELDRGLYLLCHCREFDCKPHRAHFYELAEFDRQWAGLEQQKATRLIAGLNQRREGSNVFGF